MILCFLILSVLCTSSWGVAQDKERQGEQGSVSHLVGNWSGESICVNKDKFPACHDEQVVYRIAKSTGNSAALTLTMDKIVNGRPETMGAFEFVYDPQKQTLSSEFTRNNWHGIWGLAVKGERMDGTLVTLPDKTVVRRINVTKVSAVDKESQRPAETPLTTEDAAGSPSNQSDPTLSIHIPDATVYDQNGNRLKFHTDLVKGKTVAINFIFTTCTTICPPLTATLRRVQQELGERVGRDVNLISVSVDPATDVPERLKEYAARFKAGPGWTFVTGQKVDIDSLLEALGASAADKNDHTPSILIGNDVAGYWTRAYGLAPASRLAEIIRNAASR
ncbi:MAG: hypothetical protein QOJ64_2902 [Acidobacteriota bacterium]|jgi:cytochrome oxidase Cu insertion factor (SCO1/SenC/PrrC family)|nr:hypothetical protein [Acidobacteriota bacterium]